MRLPQVAAAVFAALLISQPANGQQVPPVVQKSFEAMAKDCGADIAESGKALTSADLNGDGIPDWIIDAGELKCEMASFWCGSAGCTLNIFISHDGGHSLVWENNAHAWRPVKIGGKPGIHFDLHGSACNRVGAAPCSQRYIFEGPRLRRAK